jgi:hypothetical protein
VRRGAAAREVAVLQDGIFGARNAPQQKMNAGQQRVQNEFRGRGAMCAHKINAPEQGPPAMTRITLIALALAASTTAASAYDYSDGRGERIDAREAAQARQIQHARRTGQLTWLEKIKLTAEQNRIKRMERVAKRDGVITRAEARRIGAAQDAAARDIYRESHDSQVSWWKRW